MHIQYPKIMHISKEDCEWILEWEVYVQEKIDGANFSIRFDEEKWLCMWSRTQVVYHSWISHKEFRWAQETILNHTWIQQLLKDYPQYRLFGEYLVKHTIIYPEEHYNKFYLFDILEWEEYLSIDKVYELAEKYWINTPSLLYKWEITIEKLNELVWKSSLWVVWEWLVVKNMNFINKFYRKQYAKIVRQEFKEANQIVFWNYDRWDVEMKFATSFITEARVLKIVNKIEQNENRKIDIRDTPKVIWLTYNDVFMEEMRQFSKKQTIDFAKLESNCWKRTRFLFHDWLNYNV